MGKLDSTKCSYDLNMPENHSENMNCGASNEGRNEAIEMKTENVDEENIEDDVEVMTKYEAINLMIFNVLLPCLDIFTDIAFIIKMFVNGHLKYGFATLFPIFLSNLFIIPYWWETEKRTAKTTLPLVILQLWPQYTAFHLLKNGFNGWNHAPQFIAKIFGWNEKLSPKERLHYTKIWNQQHKIYRTYLSSLGKSFN